MVVVVIYRGGGVHVYNKMMSDSSILIVFCCCIINKMEGFFVLAKKTEVVKSKGKEKNRVTDRKRGGKKLGKPFDVDRLEI